VGYVLHGCVSIEVINKSYRRMRSAVNGIPIVSSYVHFALVPSRRTGLFLLLQASLADMRKSAQVASQLTGTGRIMRAVGRKVVIMRTVLGRIIMRTVGLTVLCRARVAYMADMMAGSRGDWYRCRARSAFEVGFSCYVELQIN
jgi:hypothetical protein